MNDVLTFCLDYAKWAINYGHPGLIFAPIVLVLFVILVLPTMLVGRWREYREAYSPRHSNDHVPRH